MPDFRVKFVGDLSQLAEFDRAIRNSAGESARQLEAANLKIASKVGAVSGIFSPKSSGRGLWVRNLKTEIDAANNTFKQSGEEVRRVISGYTTALDEATGIHKIQPTFSDEYLGAYHQTIGNLEKYQAALKATASTERTVLRNQQQTAQQMANILNQIEGTKGSILGNQGRRAQLASEAYDPLDPTATRYADKIARAKATLLDLQSGQAIRLLNTPHDPQLTQQYGATPILSRNQILSRQNQIANDLGSANTSPPPPALRAQLEREALFLKESLKLAPQQIAIGSAELNQALVGYEQGIAAHTVSVDTEIKRLQATIQTDLAKLGAIEARGAQKVAGLRGKNPAYAQAAAAASGTPPINSNLARALEQSKQLRKELIGSGLGGGAAFSTADSSKFVQNLAKQEAAVTKFTRNFRTGVTTVEGSVRQLNAATGEVGIVEKFTADIDKNGKTVTRWGGQLSGSGSILKQTVRDFQKVIEWTLATTAVFGTLGLAIKSLTTINDLNAALTRFSITAQLSASETKSLFSDLGQVAINTATPLVDLVKVADDIALATKSAGDSTDEWKTKIIDLTTAVGIFTNLTGEDTVQGADKLNSAFKQLALSPKDLIGVLNKVTAVAGGQSTAINDIVTALGGVAEAGKAAGLTIDDQIALVQVLGQVTNKSAADTATAFKNLFGSISSPGSEKILKSFGINIRDASGGLRPFLDIYREINKALESGIIPATRYQDVLRGISGGPRRAPDAAALLGNLPAVEAAIARSAGASNEALIANSKILDTNQAKITQLQNTFDIAIFEKFGGAVQQATAGLTDVLTSLLSLFNSINPSAIALLLTLGAIVVASKLVGFGLTKGVGALSGSVKSLKLGLASALVDIKGFVKQETLLAAGAAGKGTVFNAQGVATQFRNSRGQLQGLQNATTRDLAVGVPTGLIKGGIQSFKNLGAIKGIAGIGLAVEGVNLLTTALTSNDAATKQSIGQMLQLAGGVSLATGVFAPLGVAAFAAGTALQLFSGDAEGAKQSAHDSAVGVYEAIQLLKKSQEDVAVASEVLSSTKKQLDALNATGKTDVATKSAQAEATKAYVLAIIDLAKANDLASKSFDDLLAKLPGLGEKYAAFKGLITKNSGSTTGDIDRLASDIAAEILKIQGQGSYKPGPIATTYKDVPLTAPIPDAPSLVDQATAPQEYKPFNKDLLKPENLNQLFDLNRGGQRTGVDIPISAENLGTLVSSIQSLEKNPLNFNQDQIDILRKAVNDFLVASSTYFAIQNNVASNSARIQSLIAIGQLKGDAAANANDRQDLAKSFADLIPKADATQQLSPSNLQGNQADRVGISREEVIKMINDIQLGSDKGVALDTDALQKYGEALLKIQIGADAFDQIKAKGKEALEQGVIQMLLDAGISSDVLKAKLGEIPGALKAISDADDELAKKFEDAGNAALTKFAQRNAALQNAANSGEYDKNAAGLAVLRKQSEAAYNSEIKLINAIQGLSVPAYQMLTAEISKVTGMEDAANISSDQLAARLIDQAIAAGVSAKGIQTLQGKLFELMKTIDVISKIRATFQIQGSVNMNLSQYIAAMKALRASTLAAIRGNPFISPGGAAVALNGLKALNDAIAQLEKAQAGINNFTTGYNKTLSGGSGSNLGSLPSTTGAKKTGPGLDVSNLDLPTEIANSANRDALIRLAIANARKLQSKIPGATKDAKNDVVELLKGTQRILEVRGVKDDLLRKALEELADIEKKKLEFESKADTIRRIRVGAGDFAALANVPLNSQTGVSVGGQSAITVNLNINGQVLTPAQFAALADQIAAAIKRQLGA